MKQFLEQFLGTTDLPTYAAWFLLALIGAITSILVKRIILKKNTLVTPFQMILGFLITFVFIRFSRETVGLEPNAFGALLIGATNNELALLFLKLRTTVKR
jgi:hypothetical protein